MVQTKLDLNKNSNRIWSDFINISFTKSITKTPAGLRVRSSPAVTNPFLIGSLKHPPTPTRTPKEIWKQKLNSFKARKEQQMLATSCLANYMNIRQYPPERKKG